MYSCPLYKTCLYKTIRHCPRFVSVFPCPRRSEPRDFVGGGSEMFLSVSASVPVCGGGERKCNNKSNVGAKGHLAIPIKPYVYYWIIGYHCYSIWNLSLILKFHINTPHPFCFCVSFPFLFQNNSTHSKKKKRTCHPLQIIILSLSKMAASNSTADGLLKKIYCYQKQ